MSDHYNVFWTSFIGGFKKSKNMHKLNNRGMHYILYVIQIDLENVFV